MKTLPDFWFEPHLWIDGQWVRSPQMLDIRNPATGSRISHVSCADPGLLDRAIEGAARVQNDWSHRSPFERGDILKRTASLLSARKDPYARLLTAEQGKPYAQSIAEVEYAASFFQWFGEEARRIHGRIAPHSDPNREYFIEQRPVGVAGLITPWNFPLAQGAKKIAAALAAGCTAVWKPAELTPLIALAMAPLLKEAGVPDSVLQIVPGIGAALGKPFAEHPHIRVLSLTGSTRTGTSVLTHAAAGIKRVALELGGNAPFIILPDANLDQTVDDLVKLKLFVTGQVCVTANRVFVHRDFETEILDRLATRIGELRVGDGLEDSTDAGPLIHHRACQNVSELISDALSHGAKLAAENRSFASQSQLSHGSFFPPTVLTHVSDSMRVAKEEIFGPVIPLMTYTDIQEVVFRANETPYGLAAYVYGANISVCRSVARRLEVGIVGVNEWRPLRAEIPFGGVKQSGFGAEGGSEGIHEFLTPQVISLPRSGL